MRSGRGRLVVAGLAGGLVGAGALLAVGGPLDPPGGPVAATYRTLGEIEPRVPIDGVNTPGDGDSVYRIAQSGSYYLTGNLAVTTAEAGIEVAASGVTIDLNGFRLLGTGGTLAGIRAPAAIAGLVVRNGQISGWGDDGVEASLAADSVFEDLVVSSNAAHGLLVGKAARVSRCTASENGGSGFRALSGSSFHDCTAQGNSASGFMISEATSSTGLTLLDGCVATGNGQLGFSVRHGGNLTSCRADLNGEDGIGVGGSGLVHGCSALRNTGRGIVTFARLDAGTINGGLITVSSCTASGNGGDGIYAINGLSTITGCSASANTGNGIRAFSSAYILNNTCGGNGAGGGDAAGIYVESGDSRVERNNVVANDRGIDIAGSGNLITGNSASGNTVNYEISMNNIVGPIVQGALSPAISGSTGGAGVGTTNPWANLSF